MNYQERRNKASLERFKKLLGEDFEIIEFTKYDLPMTILHKSCGRIFKTKPENIAKGKRCTFCELETNIIEKPKKIDIPLIEEYIKKKNNEYELITFRPGKEKCTFKHLPCGTIFDMAKSEFSKRMCPVCAQKKAGKTRSCNTDQFKEKIKKFPDYSEYELKSEYCGCEGEIEFLHKVCNNTFKMRAHNFLKGHRCPYCRKKVGGNSMPILRIEHWLKENNFTFIKEKSFEGCQAPNGYLLRFDFFIPEKNYLIEYDGEQHEKPISVFGGEKQYLLTVEYDKIKNNFVASKENLNLLRISFHNESSIEKILSETFL